MATPPTERNTPPVTELIDDVLNLCKAEFARLRVLVAGGTGLTANDAKSLEALARTIKLTHELDTNVRKGLEDEFGKEDEAKLREEQRRLEAELEGKP